MESGVEPGPLELFKATRTKRGKWSSDMSETIYVSSIRPQPCLNISTYLVCDHALHHSYICFLSSDKCIQEIVYE